MTVTSDTSNTPSKLPAAASRPRGQDIVSRLLLRYGMLIVLVVLVGAATALYPRFLTLTNLQNVVTQNSSTAIVAIGATFVILAGGFDLSVTGSFGLGSVIFAGSVMLGQPVGVALLAALAAGVVAGIVNGLVITKLRVNAFVATLGSAAVFLGAAAVLANSRPIAVPAVPGFDFLGAGTVGGVYVSVILTVVLYLVASFVLSRTTFGRAVYATGGNREAARLAGIRVDRIQLLTFTICGFLAALAGVVLASNLSTGQFDQGTTVALDSIAAVVIGGTSLFGGEGAMWRTAVGVAILATMNNLFSSLSIASPTQNIIKGAVLILAAAFASYARYRTANR